MATYHGSFSVSIFPVLVFSTNCHYHSGMVVPLYVVPCLYLDKESCLDTSNSKTYLTGN